MAMLPKPGSAGRLSRMRQSHRKSHRGSTTASRSAVSAISAARGARGYLTECKEARMMATIRSGGPTTRCQPSELFGASLTVIAHTIEASTAAVRFTLDHRDNKLHLRVR
ncbi:hypothetical protein K466DRAFT_243123 [Polyporus arcularius HHB13444]|uniref:Uncharacterized protein n=1 Tax=Polyporus arcularius HHB13444 TaxID=1314778 RepID=A0A5C3PDG4_9APHY|nr:hypothetical protein K466DRAFT_243123 [Polyporus arcularius HHB13444]